jgi:hypothetical protein
LCLAVLAAPGGHGDLAGRRAMQVTVVTTEAVVQSQDGGRTFTVVFEF